MTTEKIGRFQIKRELGRGAQSVVYLAWDPHLERDIAIKTLHFSTPDPEQNRRLLEEARSVGRLRHPNLVPVFEAGEEGGDIFLVFEYVPGTTLTRLLAEKGAMAAPKAAALVRAVLDALAHAHEAGVIHRDLKPSNILIDEHDGKGTPRVMDFGIAMRADAARDGGLSGTPAYMAPEYIAHRTVSPGVDVFAAGLVLFELLTGFRAFQGVDVNRVMERICNDDLRLPDGLAVDERLADILYRATARDPLDRFESAAAFRQALDAYLSPESEASAAADAKQSTLDFLLRRMRHKSDFPALSESVSAINKIADSERESVAKLSSTILKDFSLTNKILRLVNSAAYRTSGGGNISTVSRAVIVLGFDAVRNIAVTVLLFEHLQNKANAQQLKEEFLRANLAAIIARDIAHHRPEVAGHREVEQAFICAMFHNLGRLLTQYYFPEESDEIKKAMQQQAISEEAASIRVLGLSYEELGIGVARTWGFPTLIVGSMRSLPPGSVRRPDSAEDRLRLLSAYSNEICNVIAATPPERRQSELRKVAARFAAGIDLDDKAVRETLERSFVQVAEFATIIRLNLQQTVFGRQIRAWSGGTVGSGETVTELGTLPGAVLADNAVLPDGDGSDGEAYNAANAQAILTAGIQDISNTLVEDFKLNDVLRIILETMYRAMGFKRVILSIKDARTGMMQGRYGFGPDATEVAKAFRFPVGKHQDIFQAALTNGVDILITDTEDPKIAPRIPEWFHKAVSARSFVIFPLNIRHNPVALIYADKDRAGDIVIPDKELSLLRTLRNQAVLAIKQSVG